MNNSADTQTFSTNGSASAAPRASLVRRGPSADLALRSSDGLAARVLRDRKGRNMIKDLEREQLRGLLIGRDIQIRSQVLARVTADAGRDAFETIARNTQDFTDLDPYAVTQYAAEGMEETHRIVTSRAPRQAERVIQAAEDGLFGNLY
jgi:hypothetical protein